jgi:hypothetical protein
MLNDELSDLAIFAVVADARSFTRAAAKLGKSQSALSQSVRRLVPFWSVWLLFDSRIGNIRISSRRFRKSPISRL